MVSVELSTRAGEGQVVVALRGELDVAEAAKVAASLAVVAASGRDCHCRPGGPGVHRLQRPGRAGARAAARPRAGFDLLLAAPQQQVLRMLAVTRLIDVFAVHACVDEASGIAGRIPVAIAPAAGSPVLLAMPSQTLLAAGDAA